VENFLVGAADEVPSHDQGLLERRAAEQEQPGRAGRRHRNLVPSGLAITYMNMS
jgi:hypothetical protein